MEREHPTRAELRARRPEERRSGRGLPELPVKLVESSVGGADSGEQPVGLDLSKPVTRRRFLQVAPPVVAATALIFSQIIEAADIDVSPASESGPTPRILPAPEDQEASEFDRTIEEINREPEVIVNQVTPAATEIRQEGEEIGFSLVQEVSTFMKNLHSEKEEVLNMRSGWTGMTYDVREGDTLESIGEEIGITPDEIVEHNLYYSHPLETLSPGDYVLLPRNIYPSEALKEVFTRLDDDQLRMEMAIATFGLESDATRETAAEIWEYWHTAPGGGEQVGEVVFDVDQRVGAEGQWIARQIEEFLSVVPNAERVLGRVEIISEEGWEERWPGFRSHIAMYSHPDKGAEIFIRSTQNGLGGETQEWTKERLLADFVHEFFGHSMSLYAEGYNLRFLTPAQVIEFVSEQTVLLDEAFHYGTGVGISSLDVEEGNAENWLMTLFLEGRDSSWFRYLDPKNVAEREDHFNRLLSATLGEPLTLNELAQKLEVR